MSFLNSSALFFFFFFFLLFIASYICSVVGMSCSSTNYTRGSGYEDSLREVYSALANASLLSLYANSSSTSNATRQAAYGMFQCRGDVSQRECAVCVNTTLLTAMQQSCPNSMGAADQPNQKCHVRYDYNPALFDGTSPDMGIWYYVWIPGQSTDVAYQNDVITALQDVTDSAPYNPNYYASTRKGLVYALAQCDGYLSASQCRSCLSNVADVSKYLNQSGAGGIYYGSCFYTYNSQLFFEITSPLSPSISPAAPPMLVAPSYSDFGNNSSSISIGAIVGGSVGGIVLLGLFIWGLLFYCGKNKRRLPIQGSQGDDTKPLFLDQVIYFPHEEIKAATLDFHPDNKIGEGGFGPVYKGMLANGLEVAIKRLSANSCQGNDEFMNEVSVITSVQHKNLIRLYGCCVEGPDERMLVYEYLPNKSLDRYLFTDSEDKSDAYLLDWKTRMNIIVGTARGLAYLHHDSQIRIIHRDIKATNILLDQDLSPKIADFGLAKLLSHDGSHVTTRIAGTLGYLSPEYAFHGYLTEKVDVYSFGVVVLEILSGRKNRHPTTPGDGLLAKLGMELL